MDRLREFHRNSGTLDEDSLSHLDNILDAQNAAWQDAFRDQHVRHHLKNRHSREEPVEEDYHLLNLMDSIHHLRDHRTHLHMSVDKIAHEHQMPHMHIYRQAMRDANIVSYRSGNGGGTDNNRNGGALVSFLERDSNTLLRGQASPTAISHRASHFRFRSVNGQNTAAVTSTNSAGTSTEENSETKAAGGKLKKAWSAFKKVLGHLKDLLLNILQNLYIGVGLKAKVTLLPIPMGGVGPNLHLCWDASEYIRTTITKVSSTAMSAEASDGIKSCAVDFEGTCESHQQEKIGGICPSAGCTPATCCEVQRCERFTNAVDNDGNNVCDEEEGLKERPNSLAFDTHDACLDGSGEPAACTTDMCCVPDTNVLCGQTIADCDGAGKIVDIEATCVPAECANSCCIQDDFDSQSDIEAISAGFTAGTEGEAAVAPNEEKKDGMGIMGLTSSGSNKRDLDQSQDSRSVWKLFKLAVRRAITATADGVVACEIPDKHGFRFCLDIAVLFPGLVVSPLPSVDWIMGYNIKMMGCIHTALTDVLAEFTTATMVDLGNPNGRTEMLAPPKRRKDYCTPKVMGILNSGLLAGIDARTWKCQIFSDLFSLDGTPAEYAHDDTFARDQFIWHVVDGEEPDRTEHTCPEDAPAMIGTEASGVTPKQIAPIATSTATADAQSAKAIEVAVKLKATILEKWNGLLMNNKDAETLLKVAATKTQAGLDAFTDDQIHTIARRIFPAKYLVGLTKDGFEKEVDVEYIGLVVWEVLKGYIHHGDSKEKEEKEGGVVCSKFIPTPGSHGAKVIASTGLCTDPPTCSTVTYTIKYDVGGWVLCNIPHAQIGIPDKKAKFHLNEEVTVKTEDVFCPRMVPGRVLRPSADSDGFYPMRLAKFGGFNRPLVSFDANVDLGTNIHDSQIILDDIGDTVIVAVEGNDGNIQNSEAKVLKILCKSSNSDLQAIPQYSVKLCGVKDSLGACKFDGVVVETPANTLARSPIVASADSREKTNKDTVLYFRDTKGKIVESLLDGYIINMDGAATHVQLTPTDVENPILGKFPKRDSKSEQKKLPIKNVLTYHKGEAVTVTTDSVYDHRFRCISGQDSRLTGVILGVESESWPENDKPLYRVRLGSSIGSTVYQDLQDESYVTHNIVVVVAKDKLLKDPEKSKTYRVCTGGSLKPKRLPGRITNFDGDGGTYTVEYGYDTLLTPWTSLGFETRVNEDRIVSGVIKPNAEMFVNPCSDDSSGENACPSKSPCIPIKEVDETACAAEANKEKSACEALKGPDGRRQCRFRPPSRKGHSALGSVSKVDYANSDTVTMRYINFEEEENVPIDQLIHSRSPMTCIKRLPGVKAKLKCLGRFASLTLASLLLKQLVEMREVSDKVVEKFPPGPCAESLMFTFGIAPSPGWPIGLDVSLTACAGYEEQIGELTEVLRSSNIGKSPCEGSPDDPASCEANDERDIASNKFFEAGSFVQSRSVVAASKSESDGLKSCKALNVIAHIRIDLSLISPVVSQIKKFALMRAQNGMRSNLISVGVDQVVRQATIWIKYALGMVNKGSLGITVGISAGPIHKIALCIVDLAKMLFSKLLSLRQPTCMKECNARGECTNDQQQVTSDASICRNKEEIMWKNSRANKKRCIHCRQPGETCKLDSDCPPKFKCHDNFVGLIAGATEGICREKSGTLMGGELCRYDHDCQGAQHLLFGGVLECSLHSHFDKKSFGVCAPPYMEKLAFYARGSPMPKPGGFACASNNHCESDGLLTAHCETFTKFVDCEKMDHPHCRWVIKNPKATLKEGECIDATETKKQKVKRNACHAGRCLVVPRQEVTYDGEITYFEGDT
eukprot:g209.t1